MAEDGGERVEGWQFCGHRKLQWNPKRPLRGKSPTGFYCVVVPVWVVEEFGWEDRPFLEVWADMETKTLVVRRKEDGVRPVRMTRWSEKKRERRSRGRGAEASGEPGPRDQEAGDRAQEGLTGPNEGGGGHAVAFSDAGGRGGGVLPPGQGA